MPSVKDQTRCLWIDNLPPHFHASYETLVLIANESHLADINPNDESILIVCCDWLVWQRLILEGRHAVHYELGILEHKNTKIFKTDVHIRANDWIYASEKDPTMFSNISLGHLLIPEVSHCLVNFYKLKFAIEGIYKRFNCSKITYFDIRVDVSILNKKMSHLVVSTIANNLSAIFDDRSSTITVENMISNQIYGTTTRSYIKTVAGRVFDFLMNAITAVSSRIGSRKLKVLVLVNRNLAVPILENCSYSKVSAAFLSRTPPREISLLLKCLRERIRLIPFRKHQLSHAELAELSTIKSALKALPARAKNSEQRVVFAFVADLATQTDRLRMIVETIKSAEHVLATFNPARIVVDGVKNVIPRAFIELAHQKNIEIDYTWHSPVTPETPSIDTLGGDPRVAAKVTRCLTWGPIHEKWLDAIDSQQPRTMIGSPIADQYINAASTTSFEQSSASHQHKNALILQYAPQVGDVLGLNANIYTSFVESVNRLRDIGFTNIRMKLHPGPGRWKKTYFEEIARVYDLDCEILKNEPFQDCVKWADIVIGPLASGALMETLAAGKNYYALLLRPHTLDPSFYGDFPIFETVESACDAIRKNQAIDGRPLLKELYGIRMDIKNIDRFWDSVNTNKSNEYLIP
ncbi:hypothetical protein OAA86_00295 [Rhodospirillales bacterium]|nr:hypothetical protein [Rhodospirillales bacterium]